MIFQDCRISILTQLSYLMRETLFIIVNFERVAVLGREMMAMVYPRQNGKLLVISDSEVTQNVPLILMPVEAGPIMGALYGIGFTYLVILPMNMSSSEQLLMVVLQV